MNAFRRLFSSVAITAMGLAVIAGAIAACNNVNADDDKEEIDLVVGSWYGNAVPQNPATSPFPEVVMIPTFHHGGSFTATDSHELTNPHSPASGSWIRTGPTSVAATFVWLNLSPTVPNGFAGTVKVTLNGQLQPGTPDSMTGTVTAVLYPPPLNPLDAAAPGIPLGTFDIVQLRRIRAN
jgi:hypothetical protein